MVSQMDEEHFAQLCSSNKLNGTADFSNSTGPHTSLRVGLKDAKVEEIVDPPIPMNSEGCNPLQSAARQGDAVLVNSLLESRDAAKLVKLRDSSAKNILYYAGSGLVFDMLLKAIMANTKCKYPQCIHTDLMINFIEKDYVDTVRHIFTNHPDVKIGQGPQFPCDFGLRHAKTPEMVNTLLDAVTPSEREAAVLICRDGFNCNPLQSAARRCKTDLVNYWLMSSYWEDLIKGKDATQKNILYWAHSVDVFESLLKAFASYTGRDYSDCIDVGLFIYFVCNDHMDVVRHILIKHHDLSRIRMYEKHGEDSGISIHNAFSEEAAITLIEAISELERPSFIMTKNGAEQTPLHSACFYGAPGLLRALTKYGKELGIWNQMVMAEDETGVLPFHSCDKVEIAEELMLSLTFEEKKEVLMAVNSDQQTTLHLACAYSFDGNVVSLILEQYSETIIQTGDCVKQLYSPDKYGDTPLMMAAANGNECALETILEYLYLVDSASPLEFLLEHQNSRGQNIFHIVLRCPKSDEMLKILENYFDLLNFTNMMQPDHLGNFPVNYFLGRFQTKLCALILMKIPLQLREKVLKWKNKSGTSGLDIAGRSTFDPSYFYESVLCNTEDVDFVHNEAGESEIVQYSSLMQLGFSGHKYLEVSYDEKIWIVIRYSLNLYDVLMSASLTGNREDNNGQELMSSRSPTIKFLDEDQVEDSLAARKEARRHVFEMDSKDNQGHLKMLIRKVASDSERRLQIPPPGPDFLILSVFCDKDTQKQVVEETMEDILKNTDLVDPHITINTLKELHFVNKLFIDSSLARHVNPSHHGNSSDSYHLIQHGGGRRALIILYTETRDGWEDQWQEAKLLLQHQLGCQVEEIRDETRSTVLENIEEFSANRDAQLLCLVVMAHGDLDGNVTDLHNEKITIQEMVTAMDHKETADIPKLLLLSFCRGALPKKSRANRTGESIECKLLSAILESSEYAPVQTSLRTGERFREWDTHPFPALELPTTYYIMYSTLPDSKSPREQCGFKMMNKYLRDQHLVDNIGVVQSHHRLISLLDSALPRVDVLRLFVDVAAMVREKSRYTQYMTHCYTVDKGCKGLIIELPPPSQARSKNIL